MNIVSLSLCYPSPANPAAGMFVRRRLAAMRATQDVRVICPVLAPFGFGARHAIAQTQGPPPAWFVHMPYVPGLSLPVNPWLYARAVKPLLSSWTEHGDVDILDAHFSWPDAVATARLSRSLGVPYAVTLRGVLGRFARDSLRRPSIVRALRGAAAVIAVSESLKGIAGELGVPQRRITVIPNAVDGEIFKPGDRTLARRALGRPDDERLMITVGHLCRRKGVHRVLQMLPTLLQQDHRIHYVVIGADAAEGRFKARLSRLTTRLRLSDRVMFTGALPPTDVARWLQASDLFVLPTANEGCCNAIREAHATGLPVVTTDVGGNRELVGRDSGILVPFGDDRAFARAIAESLADPPDRAAVIASTRTPTWERVAADTASALRRGLASAPVPVARAPQPT